MTGVSGSQNSSNVVKVGYDIATSSKAVQDVVPTANSFELLREDFCFGSNIGGHLLIHASEASFSHSVNGKACGMS